ncbi:hypothetical protein FGG08_001075 [Glutinoglossum americanum]|uniref:Uncharacterized protein n=1 Tax=Glutinoglossum americanum TaxID=1670608 RepID=A0A9P8I2R2_9PEZI|nr:hypothetical protein FGG08_001075 [Glutinoglossum americanum]
MLAKRVLFLLPSNVSWVDKLFNRRRSEGRRPQGLLAAPPNDEEEADHNDIHGGRQPRYRDDPNTDEEDADEEVIPARYRADNDNDLSTEGRSRAGPVLEDSGLAPGGNEWTR